MLKYRKALVSQRRLGLLWRIIRLLCNILKHKNCLTTNVPIKCHETSVCKEKNVMMHLQI